MFVDSVNDDDKGSSRRVNELANEGTTINKLWQRRPRMVAAKKKSFDKTGSLLNGKLKSDKKVGNN